MAHAVSRGANGSVTFASPSGTRRAGGSPKPTRTPIPAPTHQPPHRAPPRPQQPATSPRRHRARSQQPATRPGHDPSLHTHQTTYRAPLPPAPGSNPPSRAAPSIPACEGSAADRGSGGSGRPADWGEPRIEETGGSGDQRIEESRRIGESGGSGRTADWESPGSGRVADPGDQRIEESGGSGRTTDWGEPRIDESGESEGAAGSRRAADRAGRRIEANLSAR